MKRLGAYDRDASCSVHLGRCLRRAPQSDQLRLGPRLFSCLQVRLGRHVGWHEEPPWRSACGVLASWWLGLVLGTPLALLSFLVPDARRAAALFGRCALLAIGTAMLGGIGSITLAIPAGFERAVFVPEGAKDPAGFLRAAWLYEVSYMAGVLGGLLTLLSMVIAIARVRRSRR